MKSRLNETRLMAVNMTDQFLRDDQLLQTSVFNASLDNLRTEINFVRSSYESVLASYLDYETLGTRTSRSLLPLGGVLKFLFGTADDSDIQGIKVQLNKLAKSQRSVIHIMETNLSILNVSRHQIAENRQSINGLVQSLKQVDENVLNLSSRLDVFLAALQDYTVNYNNLKLIIDELSQALLHASLHVEEFKSQLNMLSTRKLFPGLISPVHLRATLHSILSQLPVHFVFPANPDTDLWYFYQTLTCTTAMSPGNVIVTVDIPLLEVNSPFDVFQVLNFDLPYFTGNVSAHDIMQYDLTATYKLESTALIADKGRTQYALLTNKELELCRTTRTCTVQSAFYETSLSKLCVISLFMKQPSKVKKIL